LQFHVLALDYDGTIAQDGRVDAGTVEALDRVRASGRKLILVTGRELDDLRRVFDREDLFDVIVAENGALLYWPSRREEQLLAEPAPQPFVAALKTANITPISFGRVIVATWEPNETVVLELIRALGLEWQITFNKGAVMVLPPGVNKETGLAAALQELGLSRHNVVGVGDAENDHAFLTLCEFSCAVANALPLVKERADFVSACDHGAGVVEVIDRLLDHDLSSEAEACDRLQVTLDEQERVSVKTHGESLLVAGASGSGKSTIAHALREQLQERGYQYCIIDPEGDYEGAQGVVHFGDPDHRPNDDSVIQHLEDPRANAVVNLLGMPLDDRPGYFSKVFSRLLEMRQRTGHPHWIIIDEAHHMLPVGWEPSATVMPEVLGSLLLVTVHPESVAPDVLAKVNLMVGVGTRAHESVAAFAGARGEPAPQGLSAGEPRMAIALRPGTIEPPLAFAPRRPRGEMHRHKRKYAEGDLQDNSFYFQGPQQKLNLRAQNLTLFLQIADGVDDETWLYHLGRGDYSAWFRECVKDQELAEVAARIESDMPEDPMMSRAAIRDAVEERYTSPG
jgi:hydroxymethylpyrimidine pyrophosphatase-like HAD family hydrolase